MSKYYYLVAGLPELTLEDSKLSYTVADFKTEIYPGISSSERERSRRRIRTGSCMGNSWRSGSASGASVRTSDI